MPLLIVFVGRFKELDKADEGPHRSISVHTLSKAIVIVFEPLLGEYGVEE